MQPSKMQLDQIPYTFKDHQLFNEVFAHVSWVAENTTNTASSSYEKLEFLGDSVLDVIIATELFTNYNLSEGDMAKVKAEVVSESSLANIARNWQLQPHIKISKGETNAVNNSGEYKDSLLCDITESVIAGIYIEQGYDKTQQIVLPHFQATLEEAAQSPGGKDYKSNLQELCVKNNLPHPTYEIEMEGPDHNTTFTTTVIIKSYIAGTGTGTSKKKSQQIAAKAALANLDVQTIEKLK